MNIGMIHEGHPDGADRKVLEHFGKLIRPDDKFQWRAMGDKKTLLRDAAPVAKELLKTSAHVFVVWDLFPPWREDRPCRKEDRNSLRDSLADNKIRTSRYTLICIREELEAWLLADEQGLTNAMNTWVAPRTVRSIARIRRPDTIRNPKARMHKIFRGAGIAGGRYNEFRHAGQLIVHYDELRRLRRSQSFARFEERLSNLKHT